MFSAKSKTQEEFVQWKFTNNWNVLSLQKLRLIGGINTFIKASILKKMTEGKFLV